MVGLHLFSTRAQSSLALSVRRREAGVPAEAPSPQRQAAQACVGRVHEHDWERRFRVRRSVEDEQVVRPAPDDAFNVGARLGAGGANVPRTSSAPPAHLPLPK